MNKPRPLLPFFLACMAVLLPASVLAAPADLVITNARIHTLENDQPTAEALAIAGNRISFVGSASSVNAHIGEGTQVIDAGGRLVLPGFVESHIHLLIGAASQSGLLLDPRDDPDAVAKRVAEYAQANPDKKTIWGANLNTEWVASGKLHRELLDKVVPDRAVILMDNTAHNVWVNSKALAVAGIDKDTQDPANGTYVRDDKGVATGLITGGPAHVPVIVANDAITSESMASVLPEMLQLLTQQGFTSAIEMGMPIATEAGYQALVDLDERGELPIRTSLAYYLNSVELGEQVINTIEEYSRRFRSEHVWLDTMKILGDGIIENRKAAMMEPYADDPGSGALTVPAALMSQLSVKAARMGFNTTVHAIGDLATHESLNAAKAVREAGYDTVFSTTHSWFIQREDIPRYVKYDVIAQTTGVWMWEKDFYLAAVGRERNDRDQFPVRSLQDLGVPIALGSDYPATDGGAKGINPFNNIYGVMTRRSPPAIAVEVGAPDTPLKPVDEVLTVDEAIAAYTINGAKMLGKEDELGSLKVGKLADLTVLSQNLYEIDVDQIPETKVMLTIMDGKVTYRDESD